MRYLLVAMISGTEKPTMASDMLRWLDIAQNNMQERDFVPCDSKTSTHNTVDCRFKPQNYVASDFTAQETGKKRSLLKTSDLESVRCYKCNNYGHCLYLPKESQTKCVLYI